jgi:hypothetical protein
MTDFEDVCQHGNARDGCAVACAHCGHSCMEHDATCGFPGCGCVVFVAAQGKARR